MRSGAGAAGDIPQDRVTLFPDGGSKKSPFDSSKIADHSLDLKPSSSRSAACRLGISEDSSEDKLTEEINGILREIDESRRRGLDPGYGRHTEEEKDSESLKANSKSGDSVTSPPGVISCAARLGRNRSRPKTRCFFGPASKRGRQRCRTFLSSSRESPPSPPLVCPQLPVCGDGTHVAAARPVSHQTGADCDKDTCRGKARVDDGPFVVLPDRPTLCHHAQAKRTPFGWHSGLLSQDCVPSNKWLPHQRLVISKELFDAYIAAEIDEVLGPSSALHIQPKLLVEGTSVDVIPGSAWFSEDD